MIRHLYLAATISLIAACTDAGNSPKPSLAGDEANFGLVRHVPAGGGEYGGSSLNGVASGLRKNWSVRLERRYTGRWE
jgi:hypothetical protein